MPPPTTPRKRTRLILATLGVTLPAIIAIAVWLRHKPSLPHFPLRDGAEFRVYQITYTSRPSRSLEHNLDCPHFQRWVYHRLPWSLAKHLPEPAWGIGGTGSDLPMLSIWWGRIDPETHQPEVGPAGDVLMTLDSGQIINLDTPSPLGDDSIPNGPSYRQIIVNSPPTNSKKLTFEVPTEDETVRFTIDNPAWRR